MSSFLRKPITMKELMECKPEEVPPKLRRIYEKEKERMDKEKSFMDMLDKIIKENSNTINEKRKYD